MSKEYTEKALIVKTGRFREADVWVRFFSPNLGAVTAFAFGGAKSRRRFCGCLDVFNLVLFRIQEGKRGEYFTLNEGTLLNCPQRLRKDSQRLALAVNCLKFLEPVTEGFTDAPGAFEFVSQTVETLDTAETISPFFPILFRGKIVFEQGFFPQLETCSKCGEATAPFSNVYFSIDQGVPACPQCRHLLGSVSVLSAEALKALQFLRDNGPNMWPTMPFSAQAERECGRIIDGFIRYHLGIIWNNGRFTRI